MGPWPTAGRVCMGTNDAKGVPDARFLRQRCVTPNFSTDNYTVNTDATL